MAPARDSCAGATLVQWLAPPGCDLRRRDDLALAGSPDDHDDAGERCSECSRQPRHDRHQVVTGEREPAGRRRDAVRVDDELGQFLTEHAVLDGHVGVLREVHGDHLVGVTRVHLDLDEVPVLVRVDEGLRVDELVLAQLHFREAERVGDVGTRSDADVGGGNDRVTEHLSLLLLAVAQEDGLVDRLLVEHDLDGNRLILVQGERDGDRVVGRDDDVLRHTIDRDRHRDGGVVRVRERDEGVVALGVLTVGVGGHFGLLHHRRVTAFRRGVAPGRVGTEPGERLVQECRLERVMRPVQVRRQLQLLEATERRVDVVLTAVVELRRTVGEHADRVDERVVPTVAGLGPRGRSRCRRVVRPRSGTDGERSTELITFLTTGDGHFPRTRCRVEGVGPFRVVDARRVGRPFRVGTHDVRLGLARVEHDSDRTTVLIRERCRERTVPPIVLEGAVGDRDDVAEGLVDAGGADVLADEDLLRLIVRVALRRHSVDVGEHCDELLGERLLLGRRSLGHGRLGRGFRVRDDQIGRDGVVEGQGIRSPNPHGREHHCRDQTNRYRSGLETRSPHGTPPICVLCKTRLWECV
jgi:hypothetical protein